jgi:phosphoribosylanthranilate isomerase
MRRGAVQIAGIHDTEEAALLVACGVDFLGFPLQLDFHPEDCTEVEAAQIIAGLPPQVESVLITYQSDPHELARLVRELGVGWVQLHGAIEPEAVAVLRQIVPPLRVVKSLVVGSGADLGSMLERHAPRVDAFLTDSFDPDTGASGATGRVHDWAVSRALAEQSPRPLVLAGGLTPGNVRRAILQVRPAAVDAHTGVEGPDGRKDPARVARFVEEARAGFAAVAAVAVG